MRTLFIASFAFFAVSVFAQQTKTVRVEKAIFNVVEEMSLRDQMLDSVFHNGKVVFNSGEVTRAFLNYNVVANGIFFLNDNKEALQLMGLSEIKLISYGKRTFMPINSNEIAEMLMSYDDGTNLLLQRISKVKNNVEYRGAYGTSTTTSSVVRVRSWNDQGASVPIDKTTEIEVTIESKFLIMKNGKITPLRKLSDLKKVYPSKWNEIKSFVSSNKINLNRTGDVIALINFCAN